MKPAYLQIMLSSVVSAVITAVVLSITLPRAAAAQESATDIVARSITLIDDNGTIRLRLGPGPVTTPDGGAGSHNYGMWIQDQNGQIVADLVWSDFHGDVGLDVGRSILIDSNSYRPAIWIRTSANSLGGTVIKSRWHVHCQRERSDYLASAMNRTHAVSWSPAPSPATEMTGLQRSRT